MVQASVLHYIYDEFYWKLARIFPCKYMLMQGMIIQQGNKKAIKMLKINLQKISDKSFTFHYKINLRGVLHIFRALSNIYVHLLFPWQWTQLLYWTCIYWPSALPKSDVFQAFTQPTNFISNNKSIRYLWFNCIILKTTLFCKPLTRFWNMFEGNIKGIEKNCKQTIS